MTAPQLAAAPLWAAGPAHHRPTGAAFDAVLLLHVLCAVVGFGTVVASAVQAGRLRSVRSAPVPAGLRSYFAPGVNWAGRTLYGVPVFGFVLLAMSDGFFHLADGWVLWGFVLWVAAIFVAEGVLWPAERRVQSALAGGGADPAGPASGPGGGATTAAAPELGRPELGGAEPEGPELGGAELGGPAAAVGVVTGAVVAECRTVVWVASGLAAVLLVAGVLMVAQP
ncbi:MAG TPA: hypothetical protein VHB02_07970 [Acidimicrobiales bacterium]|nr:hypothetical protein [Acidimicrobiales bacterium]